MPRPDADVGEAELLRKLLAEQMRDAAVHRELLPKSARPCRQARRRLHLQAVMSLSERRACSIVNGSQDDPLPSRRAPDTELRTQLLNLANARRRFGYRRLFILLREDGKPPLHLCPHESM
jgi:hypothetical protein